MILAKCIAQSYQAYDAHMNLILSDVTEEIVLVDLSEEGVPQNIRVCFHIGIDARRYRNDVPSLPDCHKKLGDAVCPWRRCDHGKTWHVSYQGSPLNPLVQISPTR